MNILVTGATGFLGRWLCPFLERQGHSLHPLSSKSCDLQNADSLDPFQKIRFDRIYHLAAWTQAGDFCLRHPGEQWLINQKINTNLLAWWQKHQPQARLIAMGTSCSYDPSLPLEEAHYLSGSPIESLFTYAMTKRMLLCGLQALHAQFGLEFLYFVPSTLYGSNYHTDERQLHFIFDLVRKIIRGAFYGEPVILWGDGEQKREVVHVEDFIEVMDKVIARQNHGIFNIGSGEEFSIRHFAKMICEKVGYPMENIVFDTTRYVGARSKILSIDHLKQIVPEYRPRELSQGLQELIDWFCHRIYPK